MTNDAPDIWDTAKVAFEGESAQREWAGELVEGSLAHFALDIPFVLKRQIRGAIGTVKHAMGDLFDTMCKSNTGAPVCLTSCTVYVTVTVTVHVNY